MKLREIAALAGGTCEGDPELEILAAAALETAGPAEVSFVANRKAAEAAQESRAGCLLVPRDFPAGRTVVRCADPRASFAAVIEVLRNVWLARGDRYSEERQPDRKRSSRRIEMHYIGG